MTQLKTIHVVFFVVVMLIYANLSLHAMNDGDIGFYMGAFGLVSIPFVCFNYWIK